MSDLRTIENKIRKCTRCPLWKYRLQALAGSGTVNAKIVVIIESPSEVADRKGDLWEGEEGRELLKILSRLNIKQTDVFLTSLVKCPSGGSLIDKSEIEECSSYLEEQLNCLKKIEKIILVSGRKKLENIIKNNLEIIPLSSISGVNKILKNN